MLGLWEEVRFILSREDILTYTSIVLGPSLVGMLVIESQHDVGHPKPSKGGAGSLRPKLICLDFFVLHIW